MRYPEIVAGTFLRRENRFIGICLVHGKSERVHIRNTSRCAELFVPGASVFLQYAPSPQKKTAYTLIALYKGERLINLDSLAPNKLVLEYLEQGNLLPGMESAAEELRGEVRYGDSRLDGAFTVAGQKAYLEIKGVTLERDGAAYFPMHLPSAASGIFVSSARRAGKAAWPISFLSFKCRACLFLRLTTRHSPPLPRHSRKRRVPALQSWLMIAASSQIASSSGHLCP